MKKLFTLCLILFAVVSVSAKGTSQFVVTTTPKMSCQNCVKNIEGNLRFEKGVKKVEANLAEQKVTVTYDPEKTNEKNLTAAFSKLKYQVSKYDAAGKKGASSCSSCSGNHNGCNSSGSTSKSCTGSAKSKSCTGDCKAKKK